MTARRAVLALGVVVAVAASAACGAGGRQQPPPGVDATRQTATLVQQLATAGVAVYDGPAGKPVAAVTAPVSPMRLLSDQVRSLALELAQHAGIPAAQLDAELPARHVGGATVAASRLLAGWARYGTSPAAAVARTYLGHDIDDPASAVFPHAVLVLFAADAAASADRTGPTPNTPAPNASMTSTPPVGKPAPSVPIGTAPTPTGPTGTTPIPTPAGTTPVDTPTPGAAPTGNVVRIAAPVGAGSNGPTLSTAPCSAVVGFVDRTIAEVFDAIGHLPYPVTYDNDSAFTKFLKTVGTVLALGANVLIDKARLVISKTVSVAIKPLMTVVAEIAGVAGTVAQVVSAVRPWTMTLTADPAANRKGVAPEGPQPGTVTARIDLGGLDQWPSYLADCAARAGTALPPLKPAGNSITWHITGAPTGLAYLGDGDTRLRNDATARTQYLTAVEPKYPDAREATGRVRITATIQRDDLTTIQNQFEDLVHSNLTSLVPPLGSIIDDIAWPVVQPWVDHAFSALAHLRDVTGAVYVPISYHLPGEPTPTTSTPPERPTTSKSSGCGVNGVASGRYALHKNVQVQAEHGTTDYLVTIDQDGKVSGTFSSHGVGEDLEGHYDGLVQATYGGTVTHPTETYTTISGDSVVARGLRANGTQVGQTDPLPPWQGDCTTLRMPLAYGQQSPLDVVLSRN